MKRIHILLPWLALSALAFAAGACSPRSAPVVPGATSMPPTSASIDKTFTDPFAYCAAVGTIDAPDVRYAGPPVPDAIINGFKKAAGLEASTEPMDMLRKTTIWRCMNNKVYACNFGANLACDSKANTDKTPTQALQDYCKANSNSDVVPMSVTGHDTIYSWHCSNETPEVVEQIGQVDPAGYLAQIWYPIEVSP